MSNQFLFTTENVLPAGSKAYPEWYKPLMVSIDTSAGGQVVIEVAHGNAWVPVEGSPFTDSVAFRLDVANGRFRFTPSGGASCGVRG